MTRLKAGKRQTVGQYVKKRGIGLRIDFFTRFSEDAGLLMILTRWHVDDPAGRMIEAFGDTIKVVKYEAIATQKSTGMRAIRYSPN